MQSLQQMTYIAWYSLFQSVPEDCTLNKHDEDVNDRKLLADQVISLQTQLDEKDQRIQQLEAMLSKETQNTATQVHTHDTNNLLQNSSPSISDPQMLHTCTKHKRSQTSQLAQPLPYQHTICSLSIQALSPCVGSLC